jgi:hypothetical protein
LLLHLGVGFHSKLGQVLLTPCVKCWHGLPHSAQWFDHLLRRGRGQARAGCSPTLFAPSRLHV